MEMIWAIKGFLNVFMRGIGLKFLTPTHTHTHTHTHTYTAPYVS